MILWIFPAMIGASLVLAGYQQYRARQQLLAAENALVLLPVDGRPADRIAQSRSVTSRTERGPVDSRPAR